MSREEPIGDLIDSVRDLNTLLETVPDSPRQRFIGCVVEAARLAIQLDAPKTDIAPRLYTLLGMADQCLGEWEAAQ